MSNALQNCPQSFQELPARDDYMKLMKVFKASSQQGEAKT